MSVTVQQYHIKDFKLSDSDNLPITLKNGLANLNLTAVLMKISWMPMSR